jgi:Flp pilus assembly pilin Flp
MADRKKFNIDFNLAAKLNSSFRKNFKRANGSIGNVNKKLSDSKIKAKKAQSSMNQFSKSVDRTGSRARRARKSLSGLSKSMVGLGAAVAGYLSINEMKNFAKSSMDAANIQIDAETKLAAVMKNTKGVTLAQIQGIKKYAGELQNAGVIGDEVAIAGTQQLATYQLQASTLKTLMPGMEDLIAQQKGLNASSGDAVNIGNMLGKVMSGQTGALSRAGINFSKAQEKVLKYGTEQEKAAMLAKVLEQNVGGVNKALAETESGKIQQINNAYGDMKEVIGMKIIPIQRRALTFMAKYLPKIQKGLSSVIDYIDQKSIKISKQLVTLKPIFTKLYSIGKLFLGYVVEKYNSFTIALQKSLPAINRIKDKLVVLLSMVEKVTSFLLSKTKPILKWIIEAGLPLLINGISWVIEVGTGFLQFLGELYEKSIFFKFIGDHLDVILVALGGFMVAVKVIKAIQTAFVAFKAAILVGSGAMKAALLFLTSPIGLIAAAIAALVAIGYMVWKHWDKIVAFLKTLWTNFSAFMSALWSAMIAKISAIGSNIKAIFSGIGQFITGAFQAAYNGTIAIFSGIGEFFKGIFGGIINFFKAGVNSWISIFNFVIDKINGVSFKVPDWVPKIGGNTVGFQIAPIPMLAKGGIATGPTLAMIGEGSESEAVLPLSKLSSLINLGKSESNSETINIQKEGSKKKSIRIDYSPVFHITSESSKSEIERLLAMDKLELERLIKRILSNEKRLSMI